MNVAILTAVIGALGTLIVAMISHFSARRREYQLKNLQFKLDKYTDFLGGFAEIGGANKTREAHLRIANAVNTMNLFASPEVLSNVYRLLDYVSSHQGDSYSVAEQNEIIQGIILAIRHDLGESTSGLATFSFRTISPGS
jgi:hypothetical protein